MTKRQTRLFFAIGTTVFAAIFVGLTIDSQRALRVNPTIALRVD